MKKIKEEYKDKVQIEFFGAIPNFSKELNANCISYSDSYKGYIEKLNSLDWDIGLAPMPESTFHSCKHYIKLIEYASNSIYPIYSNNGPYLRFNKQFKVGTMVNNTTQDWTNAIKELVDDREKLNKQRKLANEMICKEISLDKCSYVLLDDLKKMIKPSSINHFVTGSLLGLKIEGFFRRGMSFIKSRINRVQRKINKTL